MRIHTQNLNECGDTIIGSMFWHGRAWLKRTVGYDSIARLEWLFGKLARHLSACITFGAGENNRGIMLHVCIPFLFSIFLTLEVDWIRARERRLGFAVHNQSFWLYVFDEAWGDGGDRKNKWYQRYYCWYFPWQYDWYSTEILEHKENLPNIATLHSERRGQKRIDAFDSFQNCDFVKKVASKTYDYTYTLKSGKVQHRKATVYVDRMTWRMRWWPLLPFQKSKTCISVQFDGEVGEKTGSWKGGCIGCGYEMLPGESPLACLRRMEYERKF